MDEGIKILVAIGLGVIVWVLAYLVIFDRERDKKRAEMRQFLRESTDFEERIRSQFEGQPMPPFTLLEGLALLTLDDYYRNVQFEAKALRHGFDRQGLEEEAIRFARQIVVDLHEA